ncbi:MAG: 2-C-methyl-D-erythritol 4-phosphate cytidylyltransferase [bacterium]
MSYRFSAIIVAGGSGTRFGPQKKQFLKLSGVPILVRSADIIFSHPSIMQKIIVVPEGDIDFVRKEIIRPYLDDEDVEIISGGETRQESVYNGLISARGDFVIIHDGVRPLLDIETVNSCVDRAIESGGAVVCVPISETVKQVDEDVVIKTIDRDDIYLAQTPQAFKTSIITRAFEMAMRDNFTATDDSMILEYAIECGYVDKSDCEIKVVMGSPENIKITFPPDILLAEFYISQSKC